MTTHMQGPLSGTLLDGRYRVDGVVGSGGFGTVYAAVHIGLLGRVALKVPHVHDLTAAETSQLVARFLDEGRIIRQLRHPNIVTALDLGILPPDAKGRVLPFLVLEWCDGVTLEAWLAARDEPRSFEEAWALFRRACEAVDHAHRRGVAHRDLKPANVVLEDHGADGWFARVIDFGTAKRLDTAQPESSGVTRTTSETSPCTPRYAAPEQLLGLRSSAASDVYALALVFVELVRGRPVFGTSHAARVAVAQGEVPTPEELGLGTGPWSDVVRRAMARRPADRYHDAGSLIAAFDGAASATRKTISLPSVPVVPTPSGDEARRASGAGPELALRVAADPPQHATLVTVRTHVTAPLDAPRRLAFTTADIARASLILVLMTRSGPTAKEWETWLAWLEGESRRVAWDLARLPNFVVTDGGVPSTEQLTRMSVLMSRGRTLPPTAFVTSSRRARHLMRGFSVFNPTIRVFGPAEIHRAVEHVGLAPDQVSPLVTRLAHLENVAFGARRMETLRAVREVLAGA